MGTDAGAETGPYAVVSPSTGLARALAEQLFAANYPKLAGWVRRLVDDDDTAHEIASEAFVRLLSKWTSLDKLDNPQSYLFMIATNLVRDHWRKTERERRAMRNMSAGTDPEPSADPAQDVDVRELIAAAARPAPRPVPAALLRRVRHQGDIGAGQAARGNDQGGPVPCQGEAQGGDRRTRRRRQRIERRAKGRRQRQCALTTSATRSTAG